MPRQRRQGATLPNGPQAIAAVERERQALDLRKAGASYSQIARQLEYRDESGAYRAVKRALDKLTREPAEDVREMEVQRLDDLYRRAFEVIVRPHPVVRDGQVVTFTDEQGRQHRLEDETVRLRAIDTVLRVAERRSKLLGLDAPTKTELTGKDGEPLSLDVRAAQMIQRVEQLRAVNSGGPIAEIASRVNPEEDQQ